MSNPGGATRSPRRWSGWSPASSPRLSIPSWLVSVTVHGLLLFLFASNLKSCGQGVSGDPEGNLREVGIYVKESTSIAEQSDADDDAEDSTSTEQTTASVRDSTSDARLELDDRPPVDLSVPTVAEPNRVLGPGSAVPTPPPSGVDDLVRPNRVGSSAAPLDLGQGETEFFGIRDKGTRFVYVLDCSGSMYHAIRVAKAQLMASLQSLEPTQQFQVIFYNQRPHVMSLRGEKQRQLYWATEVNRTLARQFISGIQADLGTDHMPALREAMRFNPEVLFFLTDADEPILTAADLNEIRTMSRGKTRIHCIEFGQGSELSVDNFLKKLARQNGGSHRYFDINQFNRR